MIDRAVITDSLLELIADREVQAALFTTYTFEPDFFELEIVPLLLNQEMAYSSDDRVKHFMVRESLRESGLPIDIFYDLPMFRTNPPGSPGMEYLCHGVNLGNNAFHAKVSMILLKDRKTEEDILLLGSGSNNLTRAGWWDNIECQHWEEVRHRSVPRKLINILKEEIDFLSRYMAFNSGNKMSAIDRIADFVDGLRGSNSAKQIYYYGLSSLEYRRSFIDFLQHNSSPLSKANNWHLEIISPFFADDGNNVEHQNFFNMGIEDIKLFLPFDSEENALCQDTYYHHIQQEDGIEWARWQENIARGLGVSGNYFRRLHAKVYHFYNRRQSWVFVGSINFTHKALYDNVEAGFFVQLRKAGPLLESIPDNIIIDKFKEPDELIPGSPDDPNFDATLPELHIRYDWVSKTLAGLVNKKRSCYEIEIIGTEGEPVIDPWLIGYQEGKYTGDIKHLEKLLRNGSLVHVRGHKVNNNKKIPFSEHQILLQQIGWSHKPLDIPELTAVQILAIYAGMSPERRQMMLMDAKIRALVLSAQGGELTARDEDKIIYQFFSEYAEIFNAFSNFKKRLEKTFVDQQYSQLDYYLTGTGVDSLKSLVQRALDIKSENCMSSVASYLILLSALEIYDLKYCANRPNVSDERKYLLAQIKLLKKSDRLKLEDNSIKNRDLFFKWYEEEFFRTYVTSEDDT